MVRILLIVLVVGLPALLLALWIRRLAQPPRRRGPALRPDGALVRLPLEMNHPYEVQMRAPPSGALRIRLEWIRPHGVALGASGLLLPVQVVAGGALLADRRQGLAGAAGLPVGAESEVEVTEAPGLGPGGDVRMLLDLAVLRGIAPGVGVIVRGDVVKRDEGFVGPMHLVIDAP
jgi:hypothetical protein